MSLDCDIPIITSATEMQHWVDSQRSQGSTIGCVPTMGYLHDGHASLIKAAAKRHPVVIVSIFVNPTQFGPTEDFNRYPRDLARDISVVANAGGTIIFAPTMEDMYPDGPHAPIHINGISDMLEGAMRPTHFDGVATAVSRLFEAMAPDEAFFGQKDLQQTLVIRRLVETSILDVVRNVVINVQPTQREADGLAKSSRNVYLTSQDRDDAPVIYQALMNASRTIMYGETMRTVIERVMRDTLSTIDRLVVEYCVAVEATTLQQKEVFEPGDKIAILIAARLGATRLIDNEVVTYER